jgi:hypothetical protein
LRLTNKGNKIPAVWYSCNIRLARYIHGALYDLFKAYIVTPCKTGQVEQNHLQLVKEIKWKVFNATNACQEIEAITVWQKLQAGSIETKSEIKLHNTLKKDWAYQLAKKTK